jgi:arsenate reductase
MAEASVDISGQRAKDVGELLHVPFDYVITVCDHARESCPIFPGNVRVTHHGFDDPPVLARAIENEDEVLAIYRRVRDEIRDFVATLPEDLIPEP